LLPVPTVYTYRKRIYDAADVLVSGSAAEAEQLAKNFRIDPNKFRIVYNAADAEFANAMPDAFVQRFGLSDFVLMVGRISRRKGQVRLINALEGTDSPLVFIGQSDPDDQAYMQEFTQAIQGKRWVHYLGPVTNQDGLLASAYAACRVHALPSFGEFPGLVSLEAGFTGANVVAVQDPPVHEHLGGCAWYCEPEDPSSIRKAVCDAYNAPRNERHLQERLLSGFTWDHVAQNLSDIYDSVL
jgi:glycosyltransferase involved in cell wall biosynthesis